MNPSIRFSILWAASVLAVSGQDFNQALQSSKADLDKVLTEFAELQQQIADQKIPLAKQLGALEDQVQSKRREAERAQRLRDNRELDLKSLDSEVKARKDEYNYLSSLLGEYVRSFETRIHISEVQRYKALVDEAKLVSEDVNLEPADKFTRQVDVVKASLARLQEALGGIQFQGAALAPNGTLEQGDFALFGPVALFASRQGNHAGIAELQMGSPEPTVIPIGEGSIPDIQELARTGTGRLPLDATMGNALKIASIEEGFVDHLMKGGPVMIPILLLGVTAFLVGLVKYIQISLIHTARPRDLQTILESLSRGDRPTAKSRAANIKGPAGEMLLTAISHAEDEKELIEEALYEKMLHTKPRLERLLPFIALTAACAPLLGLLGTVTGMINTFNLITIFGTGDPKMLSSGISEALITTEYGLKIAIPALLVHALISRKAKGVMASMEQTAVGFINGIPGKS
jgi:biopolymer transport protein ExbB